MRGLKTIATALALTFSAVSLIGTADARDRKRHWRHHGYHHNNGDAALAGIIGFGAGAILGGALAGPRYHQPGYYYEPAPRVYYEPAPRAYYQPVPVVRSYGAAPWTPEWYSYCDGRYRSFNPRTGYFLGYDGEYHFCR